MIVCVVCRVHLSGQAGSALEPHKEVLQIDYANLKHLCAELEDSMAQLKSGHCRRILRYIR
jgi:hypothetical protein